MSKHNKTVTFEAVMASTDPDWLMDIAGECDVDHAEPEKCPNCLAYIRAQEIEDDTKPRDDAAKLTALVAFVTALLDRGPLAAPREGQPDRFPYWRDRARKALEGKEPTR